MIRIASAFLRSLIGLPLWAKGFHGIRCAAMHGCGVLLCCPPPSTLPLRWIPGFAREHHGPALRRAKEAGPNWSWMSTEVGFNWVDWMQWPTRSNSYLLNSIYPVWRSAVHRRNQGERWAISLWLFNAGMEWSPFRCFSPVDSLRPLEGGNFTANISVGVNFDAGSR